MREEIRQLLRIQDLDIDIRDLEEKRSSTNRELKALRKEVENDEKIIEKERRCLQSSQVRHKDLELQVGEKKNHIERYQQQLLKVKNNKEYTALLHEIDGHNADISALEDRILEFMEEVEAEEQKLAASRADLESARQRYRESERGARNTLEWIGREIETKKEENTRQAAKLDPELYEMYEIIFSRKPDRAVVIVENGTCKGCNMELTAQLLNDLERAASIYQCETCGRYIYLPE
jgi:hypothetical protein